MGKRLLISFLIVLGLWVRYDPVVQGKFLEVDGYYWKMLSEQSPEVRLAEVQNQLRLAPTGSREAFNLHAFITHGMSFTKLHLYEACLAITMAIIAYMTGGFILTGMMLFCPIIIARTAIGWNDTDVYIMIFSLLILHSLFSRRYLLTGFIIAGLSLFWQGWILFFCIGLVHWIYYSRDIENLAGMCLGVTLSLLWAKDDLQTVLAIIPSVNKATMVWPSGLSTTAELQQSSWHKIFFLTGCTSLIIICFGWIFGLLKRNWFLVASVLFSIFMISRGERFLLLFFPIVAYLSVQHIKHSKVICILALLGLVATGFAPRNMHRYLLIIDNGWKQTTNYIRTTPKDSVITGWWSPGHIITCLGQRSVLIDGGSQHLKRIFWISRALTTNKSNEMRIILTYLANFGDEKISVMVEQSKPWPKILQYMSATIKGKELRATYLLLYKEMFLNYPSIVKMAEWFVYKYPETKVTNLHDMLYFKLLRGGLDTNLPPQYTYNDGKNMIKIWRLN